MRQRRDYEVTVSDRNAVTKLYKVSVKATSRLEAEQLAMARFVKRIIPKRFRVIRVREKVT